MNRALLAIAFLFCWSALQAQTPRVDKELEVTMIRKSVNQTVPHFLNVLGSAKVRRVGRSYVFLNYRTATDTVHLVNKFLPDSILTSTTGGFGLKVDCKTHRVYSRRSPHQGWKWMNSDTIYLREISLDSITPKGYERFLLLGTIALFMDKAKIEEIEAVAKTTGRLNKVAYIHFPSRGNSYIDAMGAVTNRFCPEDDDAYEGVSNEVVPYGGIMVCYKKSRR